MSKSQATQFLEKVRSDKEFQEKIRSQVAPNSLEDVLDVAAVSGYVFSADELKAAAEEMAHSLAPVGVELSDEELEAVAGGGGVTVSVGPHTIQFTVWW